MKIDVVFDLSGNTCDIIADEEPGTGIVFAKIAENDIPADLEKINGTVLVSANGSEISRIVLDNFVATDQELVEQAPCDYSFGDEVSVEVNVSIDEVPVVASANLIVPLPVKPYESWVWNSAEKKYEAPVEMPDASLSHLYDWDEESQAWVLGEE